MSGVVFLMPFYLIQARGLRPSQAGQLLTALPLTMVIVAPLSGTISDRIGSRLPATLGMGLLAAGLLRLSWLEPDAALGQVVVGLSLTGLGAGIFISPNSSALMGSAPRNRQGVAAAVLATARYLGMGLGVGLAGAVFTTILTHGSTRGSGVPVADAVSAGLFVAAGAGVLGVLATAIRGSERVRGAGASASFDA